ncbi:PTS lactose/cellobiose transporter subunit IIA [Solobacterium moorei]|uniref:PTS lactose/cellobiose transporter subunit IIA n=1 Tax=Solobacterium moorei TaxID=102148 RepID=A0A412PCQ3_9FIRM|nr:PTS lactose/cellobiose transporter subunit IIA [Solobacterium moorei]RGT55004.1 PTS lactose/cellobiose transporter subunit IIA [Solobacterium moorei]
MKDNNPLIQVSMQIILYAGDARNDADTALNAAENGNFKEAVHYLKDAEKNITLAHQAQTDIVQAEMAGTNYEPCLLFSHAQDTLMTITSEIKFTKRLITLYRRLDQESLEKGVL